jgi:hypothetical protein
VRVRRSDKRWPCMAASSQVPQPQPSSRVSAALDKLARSLQTRPAGSALAELSPWRLLLVWESFVFSLVQWQAVKRKWLLVSEADLVLLRVLLGVLLYERSCRATAFPAGAGGLNCELNVGRRQQRMQRHTQFRSVLKLINEVELFYVCVMLTKNVMAVHFLTPHWLAFNRQNYTELVSVYNKAFAHQPSGPSAKITKSSSKWAELDASRFDTVFQAFFHITMYFHDTTVALAVPTYFFKDPKWLNSDVKAMHYLIATGDYTRTYLQAHPEAFVGVELSWQLPLPGLAAELKDDGPPGLPPGGRALVGHESAQRQPARPAAATGTTGTTGTSNAAAATAAPALYHILSYEQQADKQKENLLVYIEL